MRKRSFFSIALLILMLLSACASNSVPLTKEEIAALREQYPLSNELSSMAEDNFSLFQTWDGMWKNGKYEAVAVVEVTGDFFTDAVSLSPFNDEKANKAVGAERIEGVFLPAKIVEVLAGDTSLKKRDNITLGFGATYLAPIRTLDSYKKGQKYVCFLVNCTHLPYHVENGYGTQKRATFYLTEQGNLLPMTDYIRCMNECEGMTLDAFRTLAQESYQNAAR